jgi:hypothetical protein
MGKLLLELVRDAGQKSHANATFEARCAKLPPQRVLAGLEEQAGTQVVKLVKPEVGFPLGFPQLGMKLVIKPLTRTKIISILFRDMRISFAIIVFLLSRITALHAQGTPESVVTISGNVTDSVTGRGISGALVILDAGPGKAELARMRPQLEQGGGGVPKPLPITAPRRAVTDENGKYSITLPEPTFVSIHASHSSYLDGFSRGQRDFAQGVNVKLVPTSVIEGRVVNSDGEPLPGITVEVIQEQIQDGRMVLRPLTGGRTNDLGEYRFWNIAAKSVYVRVAGYQGRYFAAGNAPQIADSREAFPTVYFPAAPDRQSASVIRVSPGQTVRSDFSISSRKSYRIGGVIRDAASYTALNVRLLNGEDSVGNRVSINTSSGEFQVYDVTPGTYTLQAYSNARGRSLALGEASVVVGEQDLTGVVLSLSAGVAVQGMIEHVGADNAGAAQQDDADDNNQQNVRRPAQGLPVQAVILQPWRLPVTGTQPPATVDAQGHFTFTDMLPGNYAFTIYTGAEYIESIRSGTTDVLADGLQLGSVSPQELRVTLRRGGGRIQGSVTGLQPGEPATIALIRAAGLAGVPTIARTFIDESTGEAQFQANNLAPGEYLLYAWPSAQEVEYRNPEALRALSGSAVAVSLHEHGEERVKLKAVSTAIQ